MFRQARLMLRSSIPKGEFGIYFISDGANKPYRMKIRAPGLCTWLVWMKCPVAT
jgi:NADH:ubiquinone oxidoreductase subunit D